MSKIHIIGCGPGHPGFLTAAAFAAVIKADLLVGAEHLLNLFPSVECQRIAVCGTMTAVLDQVDESKAETICVLVSGDTGLFSLARMFINRFGRERCQLLPGISSIQLACARLAIDWCDLKIISGHGRIPDADLDQLRQSDKIALLAGDDAAITWLADQWQALGSDYEVASCENLSLETEAVRYFIDVADLRAADLPSRTILFLCKKGIL
jgi:cobalt-precorrin-7 (C5)-methyltransferase